MISLHLLNTVGDFCEQESDTCDNLKIFLTQNFLWMNDQMYQNNGDPYWHQVS